MSATLLVVGVNPARTRSCQLPWCESIFEGRIPVESSEDAEHPSTATVRSQLRRRQTGACKGRGMCGVRTGHESKDQAGLGLWAGSLLSLSYAPAGARVHHLPESY